MTVWQTVVLPLHQARIAGSEGLEPPKALLESAVFPLH